MKRALRIAFIGLDALMIAFVLIAATTDLFTVNLALWNTGLRKFRYFTVDSNVLAALTLLAALPFKYRRLVTDKPLPHFCSVLSLVGVTASSVTFMTVLLFLGPRLGYANMFLGGNLLLHLVCPVCMAVSFIFDCGSGKKLKFRYTPLSLLPTVIYAVLYLIMVIAVGADNGGWEDFYGFNAGGMWYISGVLMFAGTYAIGVILWAAHKISEKRENESY